MSLKMRALCVLLALIVQGMVAEEEDIGLGSGPECTKLKAMAGEYSKIQDLPDGKDKDAKLKEIQDRIGKGITSCEEEDKPKQKKDEASGSNGPGGPDEDDFPENGPFEGGLNGPSQAGQFGGAFPQQPGNNPFNANQFPDFKQMGQMWKMPPQQPGGMPQGNGFGMPQGNGFGMPQGNGFGMPQGNGFGMPQGNGFGMPQGPNAG